jgi:hypothetical protein
MIVAHRLQKRRIPRNAPRLCGSVRRDEKSMLLNDCLAWLVPRRKTRARRGRLFLALDRRQWDPVSDNNRGEDLVNQPVPSTTRSDVTGNRV